MVLLFFVGDESTCGVTPLSAQARTNNPSWPAEVWTQTTTSRRLSFPNSRRITSSQPTLEATTTLGDVDEKLRWRSAFELMWCGFGQLQGRLNQMLGRRNKRHGRHGRREHRERRERDGHRGRPRTPHKPQARSQTIQYSTRPPVTELCQSWHAMDAHWVEIEQFPPHLWTGMGRCRSCFWRSPRPTPAWGPTDGLLADLGQVLKQPLRAHTHLVRAAN